MANFDKRKPFFDFPFDFDKLEGMMDQLMNDMMSDSHRAGNKPVVFGINMRFDPKTGKPVVEEFGNVSQQGGQPVVLDAREPLVDIQETGDEVLVTAELPGVEKKDVNLVPLKNDQVEISVNARDAKFYKIVKLPSPVLPETAKANFNNGILEVTFKKDAKSAKPKIKIE
ncbi:MAG: archaeal heat shock protein Hsp20 [Candidatus Diapherotrites archaeon]